MVSYSRSSAKMLKVQWLNSKNLEKADKFFPLATVKRSFEFSNPSVIPNPRLTISSIYNKK